MAKNSNLFFVLAAALFCSCSFTKPELDMKPPVYVEQLEPASNPNKNTQGSLFGQGSNPLFSDNKAKNVNDIVTIIIKEDINQTSKTSKTSSKATQTNLGAGVFSGALAGLNDKTNASFSSNSVGSFAGNAGATRLDKFQTKISARIIKVLENGNYFIQGNKEMLINGEKQILKISGVIRPYDISAQNTIESKYISDAKIAYDLQGDAARAIERGWLGKILESLWPF